MERNGLVSSVVVSGCPANRPSSCSIAGSFHKYRFCSVQAGDEELVPRIPAGLTHFFWSVQVWLGRACMLSVDLLVVGMRCVAGGC
jgi:hypothetical protein